MRLRAMLLRYKAEVAQLTIEKKKVASEANYWERMYFERRALAEEPEVIEEEPDTPLTRWRRKEQATLRPTMTAEERADILGIRNEENANSIEL